MKKKEAAPRAGLTRCYCGCKYWDKVKHPDTNRKWWECHSCGEKYDAEMEQN